MESKLALPDRDVGGAAAQGEAVAPTTIYGALLKFLRGRPLIETAGTVVSLLLYGVGQASLAIAAALAARLLLVTDTGPVSSATSRSAHLAELGFVGQALGEGPSESLVGLVLCFGLGAAIVKTLAQGFLSREQALAQAWLGRVLRESAGQRLLRGGAASDLPAQKLAAALAVRIGDAERALGGGAVLALRSVAQIVPLGASLILVSQVVAIGGALALLPLGVLLARFRRRLAHLTRKAGNLAEQLHENQDELLTNVELWRSYDAGHVVLDRLREDAAKAGRVAARAELGRSLMSGGNEVLAVLGLLGVWWASAWLGVELGSGTLLVSAVLVFMAYRPLRDLGDSLAAVRRGDAALQRLGELLDDAPIESGHRSAVTSFPAVVAPEASKPEALVGHNFGAAHSDVRIDVELQPGELVALVGRTGSGKTMLLRALLGLVPAVGSLRYGERDLSRAGTGPRERPFAWVPQDAPLVTGTLLDNVTLFGAERRDAARALARVGIAGMLDELAATRVGPGGRALSGGERRLVSLARGYATELPVLLLDEPLAGLDGTSVQRVLAGLGALKGTRSMLVATHRPELIQVADRVLRIDASANLAS